MRRILRNNDDESSLDSRSIVKAARAATSEDNAAMTSESCSTTDDDDEDCGLVVTIEQARRALEYYASEDRELTDSNAYARGVEKIQTVMRRLYEKLVSDASWTASSRRLFDAIQHGTPVSYAPLPSSRRDGAGGAGSTDSSRLLDLSRRGKPLRVVDSACVTVEVRANSRYYWEMEKDLHERGSTMDIGGVTTADPGSARSFDERFFAAGRHDDLENVEVRVRRLEDGKCVDAYVRPIERFVIDGGAQRAFVQNMYEMFAWHWTAQGRWTQNWIEANDDEERRRVAEGYAKKLNLHLRTHDALLQIVDTIETNSTDQKRENMSFFGKFAKTIGPPSSPSSGVNAAKGASSGGPPKPSSKLAKMKTKIAKQRSAVAFDQKKRQALADAAVDADLPAARNNGVDTDRDLERDLEPLGDVVVPSAPIARPDPPPTTDADGTAGDGTAGVGTAGDAQTKKKKRPTAFDRFYAKHKTSDTKKTYLQQRWREMTDEEKKEYGAVVINDKKRKASVAASKEDDADKNGGLLDDERSNLGKKRKVDPSLVKLLRDHFDETPDDNVAFVWRLFLENLEKTTKGPNKARRTPFESTPFAGAKAKSSTVPGAMRALRDVPGIEISFRMFNILFAGVFAEEEDEEDEDEEVVFA